MHGTVLLARCSSLIPVVSLCSYDRCTAAESRAAEPVGVQLEQPQSRLVAGLWPKGQYGRLELQVPWLGTAAPDQVLTFSGLRSSANLLSVSLVDPYGLIVWTSSADALHKVPSALTPDPVRGNAYAQPASVLAPTPGGWALNVTAAEAGRLEFAYSLRPRYWLTFPARVERIAPGQPWVLTVLAWNGERPLERLNPLTVVATDAAGHADVQTTAVPSLTTALGVVVPAPAGTYHAVLSFPRSGVYRVRVSGSVAGLISAAGRPTEASLLASILIDVGEADVADQAPARAVR